ncbi:MAG: type III polyketide synthase, partial [Maribacter dokdonensis]
MNYTRIVTVTKELPPYYRNTEDIIPLVKYWLSGQEERFTRKVVKIFEGAAVDKRYSIMPPEDVFQTTSFEDKNKIYSREAKRMGGNVLKKALDKSNWAASSIDYIITVSCTGIMIP